MSSYSGEFLQSVREGVTTTTDATVTTIETINMTPSKTFYIRSLVVGRRTGGSAGTADDSGAYVLTVCYKDVSGTPTIVGALDKVAVEDQGGWDATITTSGSNILVRVTGAANNNITWGSHTELTVSAN